MSTPAGPIRLLLIEDIPQVVQHIRRPLGRVPQAITLLDVLADDREASRR